MENLLRSLNTMNKQKEKSSKRLKTARFIFKVSPELKEKIQDTADSKGISASQYIIQLIQKDLGLDPKEYR